MELNATQQGLLLEALTNQNDDKVIYRNFLVIPNTDFRKEVADDLVKLQYLAMGSENEDDSIYHCTPSGVDAVIALGGKYIGS